MSQSSEAPTQPELNAVAEPNAVAEQIAANRPPSYVKLAMRNMVRKRGKSLYHFALTLTGLLTVLIGLAYLTR